MEPIPASLVAAIVIVSVLFGALITGLVLTFIYGRAIDGPKPKKTGKNQ
jgi:hypothetical protein